jgi:lysophospholipase L1-like esterase|tara:strand:+ start:659 stop:1279 length:621 start_codon:yes stop_codon:yes gene_type:complete
MKGILCFGDSLTFGVGETPTKGWVGRLKEYYEPKGEHNCVFNLGIRGDSTNELVKRIDTELKARIKYIYPQDNYLVIISIGINDSRRIGNSKQIQTNLKLFKKNIIKLSKISKKYTEKIIFIGITPVDEKKTLPYEDTYFSNKNIKEYNKIIENICKKNNILFINLFKILKKKYKKLLKDGIHLNSTGYNQCFKEIKSNLIKYNLL